VVEGVEEGPDHEGVGWVGVADGVAVVVVGRLVLVLVR